MRLKWKKGKRGGREEWTAPTNSDVFFLIVSCPEAQYGGSFEVFAGRGGKQSRGILWLYSCRVLELAQGNAETVADFFLPEKGE